MAAPTIEPVTTVEPIVVHTIDDMLRLTGLVRSQRHRDPLRALENLLLEMRASIR